MALYTGLRPGELRALTVNDVDLTARTITVSKSIDARSGVTKPPKTESGQRVVPIHPELAPLLQDHSMPQLATRSRHFYLIQI